MLCNKNTLPISWILEPTNFFFIHLPKHCFGDKHFGTFLAGLADSGLEVAVTLDFLILSATVASEDLSWAGIDACLVLERLTHQTLKSSAKVLSGCNLRGNQCRKVYHQNISKYPNLLTGRYSDIGILVCHETLHIATLIPRWQFIDHSGKVRRLRCRFAPQESIDFSKGCIRPRSTGAISSQNRPCQNVIQLL